MEMTFQSTRSFTRKLILLTIVFASTNLFYGYSQAKLGTAQNKTLIIEGQNIWIREYPKTGKVLFTLNEGATCNVLEKGEKQIIRGLEDFWYKIEHNNKVGWVFGSQSFLRQKASLDNFEPYLKYFVKTCLLENNLDSLLLYKSPIITQFQHKNIGFYRLFNPGAACVNAPIRDEWYYQNLKYYYNILSEMVPLNYYQNKLPNKGFCEESTEKDGVYYDSLETLPTYFDFNTLNSEALPLPSSYKSGEIIRVIILNHRIVWTSLYFILADGRWWFIVKDDCDCSA